KAGIVFSEKPPPNPPGISVQGGDSFSPRDAGKGPRHVGANARKPPQSLHIVDGDLTFVVLYDLPCRLVEVAGPAVVTQTLPELKNLLFGGPGQTLDVGKAPEKGLIVGDDRFHLSLLQH